MDLDRQFAEVFQAPEGVWNREADRVRLDVFSLGALAYYLIAGRAPALDSATLRDRLQRDGGLDLAADLPQVSVAMRRLVLQAARPAVSERLRDVARFLAGLADAEQELAAPGLFDFSLTRAGAATLTAGTPPYLDPFLEARGRYDSAAERYAAAVVLFEMATGKPPVYGDGESDPLVIDDEASVSSQMFDSSVAAGLLSFFRTALARDAAARHHTAADMLAA